MNHQYHEGWYAFVDGKPASANQYQKGTYDYESWQRGYDDSAKSAAAKSYFYEDDM